MHGADETIHIEERAGRGRCVIAARALAPGTEISALSGAPYAVVQMPSHRERGCAACFCVAGSSKAALLRCTACKQTRYCSARCQQSDWAQHRHECKLLRQLPKKSPKFSQLPEGVVAELLLAGRCLHRRAAAVPGDAADLDFDGLCSSDPSPYTMRLAEVGISLPGLAPDGTEQETFARLLAAFLRTSFGVLSDLHSLVGAGCYPRAALLNHSCAPNCCLHYSGTVLRIRTIRAVDEGEELCHSFADLAAPRQVRQAYLRNTYGFECRCEGCWGPAAGPLEMRMVEGYLFRDPARERAEEDQMLEDQNRELQESKSLMMAAAEEEDDAHARSLGLRALEVRRRLCGPASVARHYTEMAAFARALEAGDLEEARECCANVVTFLAIALAHVPHHPLLALQRHTLADLHANCGDTSAAVAELEKAVESLRVCYGSEHSGLCRRAGERLEQLRGELTA